MSKNKLLLLTILCCVFTVVALVGRSTNAPQELIEEGEQYTISQIQRDIIQSEYDISEVNTAVYQAPNRENGIRTTFTENGVTIAPRAGDTTAWTLGMHLMQVGDATQMVAVGDASLSAADNQVYLARGDVVEWYVNSQRGLEQGFTIEQAPFGAASDELYVDVALSGTLVAHGDNDAISFRTADGAPVLSYSELYAFDAESRPLPATMTLVSLDGRQTIRIAVDSKDAQYPIVIDPLTNTPDWTGQTDQDDLYGFSVSSAGDFNGDGYDDIIVGAPWFDNGEEKQGMAFIYLGGPGGLSTTYSESIFAFDANAELGYSVSGVGDTNNDGFDDVIMGAPGSDFATVCYGSSSGTCNGLTDLDGLDGILFGAAVSDAGDVNNDGFADVIVGAPDFFRDLGEVIENSGRAYVFHGSGSGVNTSAAWIAEDTGFADSDFGFAVGGGGDITGDGIDDVIVSDPTSNSNQEKFGVVYIFPGSDPAGLPGGTSATPGNAITAVDNPNPHDQSAFGHSIDMVDGNGDGIEDLAVGDPFGLNGQSMPNGAVYAYAGPLLSPPSFATFNVVSNVANSLYGYSVASAGDIDNDGFEELILGIPGTTEGRIDIFPGDQSTLFDFNGAGGISSDVTDDEFGHSVSSAGDVNGDGFDDILIGSPAYDDGSSGSGWAFSYFGTGQIRNATASNDGPTPLGEPTTFTVELDVPDSGLNTYSWDFGDGSIGEGKTVEHTYAAAGSYTAVVTVTNMFGSINASTTANVTINVLIDPATGGSATFDDGQGNSTNVNVPGGAVDNPVNIEYTPLTLGTLTRSGQGESSAGIEQPLPANNTNYFFDLDAGEPFRVYLPAIYNSASSRGVPGSLAAAVPQTPQGTSCPVGHFCFNEPVTIVISYNEAFLNGQDENDLEVVWWDEATMSWLDAAATCDTPSGYIVDPVNNTLTFQICQISRFGMIGAN